MSKLSIATAAALLSLIACGGGGTPGSSDDGMNMNTSCTPSGTALQITAKDTKFDLDCLAAPAGQAFTLTLRNDDAGIQHSVDITTKHNGGTTLFDGELITGPVTKTYNVSALAAGTYHFHCEVHPVMNGAFVVK
jgi:plastocyanin